MGRRGSGLPLKNRLRFYRTSRGLSQEELARLAGLSRQTVNAMEAGRCIPNTSVALRLARVLGCQVEELFQLEETLPEHPVEVAQPAAPGPQRVLLAKVGARLVAHPLLAERALLEGFASADALLDPSKQPPVARLLVPPHALERTAFVLGCDPSLGILASHLMRRRPDLRLAYLSTSSQQALDAVAKGEAHLAGSHLRDPDSQDYNVIHARKALGRQGGLVVAFTAWEQGLVVSPNNPKGITSVADLARPDVRLVNREPGAGTRQLLDDLLAHQGIPPSMLRGYQHVVGSHLAVARAVAHGMADAGPALRAAAQVYGLGFIPLAQVRFDLVIPRSVLGHPTVSLLLDLLQDKALRAEIGSLPGYEVRTMGTVVADIPPLE